mmetsp:Transcript_30990/g.45337  ORF Transcript_30990/g.45337 Transcript_30990/m.45337 type:complete len:93 (+) Transcript_30990:285-563(+)
MVLCILQSTQEETLRICKFFAVCLAYDDIQGRVGNRINKILKALVDLFHFGHIYLGNSLTFLLMIKTLRVFFRSMKTLRVGSCHTHSVMPMT